MEKSVLCEFAMFQGRHPIASLPRGIWLFSFFSILLGAWNSGYPAGVRFNSLTIGSNNIPRIEHDASSNYYYLLLRGTVITDINQPVNARLFTSTNGVLTDSNAFVSVGSVFYRVREVPVEEPLDSDGDGLSDVFE